MDRSHFTYQKLVAELDGARKYLVALERVASLNGKEKTKKAEMLRIITALESAKEKLDATRS
jgi:hypothetical protein